VSGSFKVDSVEAKKKEENFRETLRDMANSKYEYVKSFELEDEVMLPNLMVVRIDGRDFSRFSQVHEFEKPNDETALNLMNSCSAAVLEEFPDIIFAYGYSDEYSFVFKKTSRFYQRRASKILSLVASFFAAVYVTKWKEFFPQRKLLYAPSFSSKVVSCASAEVLQAYLAWRQQDCHANNQYDTCFWMLVKSGKSVSETQEILKMSKWPFTFLSQVSRLVMILHGLNTRFLFPLDACRIHKNSRKMSFSFRNLVSITRRFLNCFAKDLVFSRKRWKKL
jgi:tRNA(His) guanylyltransferase